MVCWVDFNIVAALDERTGNSQLTRDMEDFFYFIGDAALIDINMSNGQFTWLKI